MNVIMNRLPGITWNRLNMNRSTLDLEGVFENHRPEAQWNTEELSWNDASEWKRDARAHGFSPDVSALTESADTALAETAAGIHMEKPLVLRYVYQKNEKAVSRVALHAAEGSTLDAVILAESPADDSSDVTVLQVEIQAEKNARVNLYMVQITGKNSICLHEVGGTLQDSAKVTLTRLELGARSAYTGVDLDLLGAQSEFQAQVGYHSRPGQLLDMNYVALHHGENTNSLMEAAGTLEEGSKKIFRGTIDFQQGCAGAKGTENENVLLIGDNMVNQTIPLILCQEEDVEGNHGASIGQLDDKVLFYLGARGIAPQDAQQMISRARIQAVCSRIPDEEIRSKAEGFEWGGEEIHE